MPVPQPAGPLMSLATSQKPLSICGSHHAGTSGQCRVPAGLSSVWQPVPTHGCTWSSQTPSLVLQEGGTRSPEERRRPCAWLCVTPSRWLFLQGDLAPASIRSCR